MKVFAARRAGLAAVVGGGLRMDEQASNLRGVALELGLEAGDEFMDARHGEIVRKGAMTGDLDEISMVVRAARARYEDVVDVEDAGDRAGEAPQPNFKLAVAFERGRLRNGGGLTLDVGKDGPDLRNIFMDVCFELGDEVMRFAERHGFVDFEMLFQMKALAVFLQGKVVDGEVGAGGDGPDAIMNGLRLTGKGYRMDDDVGAREMAIDGRGRCLVDLLGALEGEIARHAEREVGEETWTRLPDAKPVDAENAVDGGEFTMQIAADVRGGAVRIMAGRSVQKVVDGLPGKPPGHTQDDGRHCESGDGISDFEAPDVEAFSEQGCKQTEEDGRRGPDIRAEVDSVCFKRERLVFLRGLMKLASAREINGDREQKDDEGPGAEGEREMLAKDQAAHGLGDDPDAGAEHENGLDKRGEALDLAVTIVVFVVGRTIGDANGKERDEGRNKIDGGVRCFGQHAERSGEQTGEQLERCDDKRGEYREESGGALGGASRRDTRRGVHRDDATWSA